MLGYFSGGVAKALAAYNWGQGRLDRLLQRHPDDWLEHVPPETRRYLEAILGSFATAGAR